MEKKLVFLPFIYFNFCNAGLVSATQQCESATIVHALSLGPLSGPPLIPSLQAITAQDCSLCYTATSHQLSILHLIVHICWRCFLHSSHSLPLLCKSYCFLHSSHSLPLLCKSYDLTWEKISGCFNLSESIKTQNTCNQIQKIPELYKPFWCTWNGCYRKFK